MTSILLPQKMPKPLDCETGADQRACLNILTDQFAPRRELIARGLPPQYRQDFLEGNQVTYRVRVPALYMGFKVRIPCKVTLTQTRYAGPAPWLQVKLEVRSGSIEGVETKIRKFILVNAKHSRFIRRVLHNPLSIFDLK